MEMPETSTSMKEFTSQGSPRFGSTEISGVIMAPAMLAKAAPRPKVVRRTRVLSMPRPRARSSFMMTARAFRPKRVK